MLLISELEAKRRDQGKRLITTISQRKSIDTRILRAHSSPPIDEIGQWQSKNRQQTPQFHLVWIPLLCSYI